MGLLASCAKELNDSSANYENDGIKTVLEVGLPSDVKTTLGEPDTQGHRKVYWSNGDQININGTTSAALSGVTDDAVNAMFTFEGSLTLPYKIVYPASILSKNQLYVTLPGVQTWKSGGFADGMFPMVGYSESGTGITLNHLCAAIKVSVKRASVDPIDTDDIVAVRVKGRNNEKLSGAFNHSCQDASLAAESGSGEDLEVKVVKTVTTSTSEAAVFYLVIPSRVYSNGIDIIVQDKNGHIMTKSKTGYFFPEKGHIYALPEFEFVPTDTELGIQITSAQDLINFATAYNNKEYEALGSSLVATLANDITFDSTTSADFNATGGIGLKKENYADAEDYYFNGTLNGGNHSIAGLAATVPLCKATGSSGSVKNLTVDNTCSFTFTHPKDSAIYYGAIVGYHKGTVDNVNVAANVSLAAVEDVAKITAVGGCVGRATTGVVKNSSYSGNISIPSGFTASNRLLVGGLVGYFSNAGGVTDSDFDGTIAIEALVSSSDKTNPYLVVGGVAGYVTGGATISGCSSSNHPTVAGIGTGAGYNGTIVNKTTKSYFTSTGGIVGELYKGTVSTCTNDAAILNTIIRSENNDNFGRYLRVGGIAGIIRSNGNVSGCTNNGSIYHRSDMKMQCVGGICGYNEGTVSGSSNSSTGTIELSTTSANSYSARIPYIGGVIGANYSANVSNVQNAANIKLERTENNATIGYGIGGVIGFSSKDIDGTTAKNITNSGNILQAYNPTVSCYNGLCIGGIVGRTEGSVKNVVNNGTVEMRFSNATSAAINMRMFMGGIVGSVVTSSAVEISGCVNNGEVFYNINGKGGTKDTNTGKVSDTYVGGILGTTCLWTGNGDDYVEYEPKVTISNCTNNGYVHGGNGIKHNGTSNFTGGIVAYLAGASSISNCTNTANVFNDQFTNTVEATIAAYSGGIAAYIIGSDTTPITVTGCEHNTSDLGPRRGYVGGIVGYANYATITDCDNVNTSLIGSAWYLGGIAGWTQNSTISSCDYTGTTIYSTQIQDYAGGGIAAKIDATTISGCNSSVTSIFHTSSGSTWDKDIAGGAIAGISGDGNTIQNCRYKATINSVAANVVGTGTFTGTGNAADL